MILLSAALISVSHASTLREWWSDFCEHHLIADDPWQYRDLNVDQLVNTYHRYRRDGVNTRVLVYEVRVRLAGNLSADDREILSKTLANERVP